MPSERKLYKYATYLSKCSHEAIRYGNCVAKKAGEVNHLACEREFALLIGCVKQQRYKRAKRLVAIYKHNFGLVQPYRVLIDGTFAMAALQSKINLREQMAKYLNAEVQLHVTRCVLNELEKLGPAVYGALHICKQFSVQSCPHQPVRTASECIKHMGRRMKHEATYFIATQDASLTEALKQIPGVPILFIKYNAILIDKPSQATIEEMEKPKDELQHVKELKKVVFGHNEIQKRKRKGPKGPNPLSVKRKKRKKTDVVREINPNARTASGKRRRRRKKNTRNDLLEEH